MEINNHVYKVLAPIVNHLLFEKPSTPSFNLGNAKLSDEFISFYNNNYHNLGSLITDQFLINKINFSLENFNLRDRAMLSNIILKDVGYADGFIWLDEINKKKAGNDIYESKNLFDTDIANFIFEGKICSILLLFFKLLYEDLNSYSFSNLNSITEAEYFDLYFRYDINN